jgi:hypothetical protein
MYIYAVTQILNVVTGSFAQIETTEEPEKIHIDGASPS